MRVVSYESLALQWHPGNRRDSRFAWFALFVAALFLAVGITISLIPVPQEERKTIYEVPERVAKFILEKPKPKPKPIPKIEEPKPKPKPRLTRKEKEKEVKLTKKQQQARAKAEDSGLLALSQELADLVDTSSIDSMVGQKINSSGNSRQATTMNTDILTQPGVTTNVSPDAGQQLAGVGKTQLSTQQQAIARTLINSRAAVDSKGSKTSSTAQNSRAGANYRSEEDIAYVMDRNKSKLHNLYRQARRTTPGLKGKIVLEITILPSGKVSNVRVKSSDLNNPKLESRLIARVRQFDFGSSNTKTVTVTFPVEFLPS